MNRRQRRRQEKLAGGGDRPVVSNPKALLEKAVAHHRAHRWDRAETLYKRLMAAHPEMTDAPYNLANAYLQQKKVAEAIDCYRRVVAIDPDDVEAAAKLLHQLQHACLWDEAAIIEKVVAQQSAIAIQLGKLPGESPFLNVVRCPDPATNLKVARLWSTGALARVIKTAPKRDFGDRRIDKTPLTIGYLCRDFRDHATAHLMRGLFRHHDHDAFNIHAYHYGEEDGSRYQNDIREACDAWVDLRGLNHLAAAERIHDDGVDILVDVNAFTQGNRMEICALRPAPVQVSYLAFPGTTGATYFDYLIADPVVVPPEQDVHYGEALARMPYCYQANDDEAPIAATVPTRSEAGLPEDVFVFACFSQTYKIEPVMFDAWMDILKSVPDSVLWLFRSNEAAPEALRQAAVARGVDAGRLVFAGDLPKAKHLARLGLADLGLDTRVYTGHTTTSDALWAGLPVITVEGTHFASRVSASILRAHGMEVLVTADIDAFKQLAIRLAGDAEALADLRRRVAANRETHPLFDTARFTRDLEDLYRQMWQVFVAGGEPRAIGAAAGS